MKKPAYVDERSQAVAGRVGPAEAEVLRLVAQRRGVVLARLVEAILSDAIPSLLSPRLKLPGLVPYEQLVAMTTSELAALKDKDAALYIASLEAMGSRLP